MVGQTNNFCLLFELETNIANKSSNWIEINDLSSTGYAKSDSFILGFVLHFAQVPDILVSGETKTMMYQAYV